MIYLEIFWIIFLIIILIIVLKLILRKRKRYSNSLNDIIDGIITALFIGAFGFIVLGILTDDPIFAAIGLPPEFEWIGGLSLFGFSLWLFYLAPLKNRVIKSEKDIVIIKTDVKTIREDVHLIKEKIINGKIK